MTPNPDDDTLFLHIDMAAVDAQRKTAENAPERMESFLRFVRTFRETMFDPTSDIKYQVDECCRKWWAEARAFWALFEGLPQVPSRPEQYDNQDYVEARIDELESWLEQSLVSLTTR